MSKEDRKSDLDESYFKGLSFQDLWTCIAISNGKEELETVISATQKLNQVLKAK